MNKFKHSCVTHWIGDGLTVETAFRPAYDGRYPNGAYGEPRLGDQVCHVEYETDNPTDAQAVDDSADTLVLHSENPDGTPRLNKDSLTTAGQRTAIVNWLQNKGVTNNQLLWMKDRFAEIFGHPWSEATRGEVGKVIRVAVRRRFQ